MAGTKGKSGGARPGAGRKPVPKPANLLPAEPDQSPLDFLLAVQNNPAAAPHLRVRAAVTAAQYVHTRRADGGKREGEARGAKKAGKGRFAPGPAPLRAV